MTRREPEGVIDGAPVFALGRLGKRGWFAGFLPGAAEICGTKYGGAEVAGFSRCQKCSSVARIEHEVIDDVAEKVRPVDSLGFACRITVK